MDAIVSILNNVLYYTGAFWWVVVVVGLVVFVGTFLGGPRRMKP